MKGLWFITNIDRRAKKGLQELLAHARDIQREAYRYTLRGAGEQAYRVYVKELTGGREAYEHMKGKLTRGKEEDGRKGGSS